MPVPMFTPRTSLYLGGCVSGRSRYEGSLLTVDEFRCLHDGAGLREERWHSRPVLSLCFAGASISCHGTQQTLVDPTRASFRAAELPYRTLHPWGCSCHGVNIVLRRDLAEELSGGDGTWGAGYRSIVLSGTLHVQLRRFLAQLERKSADALKTEEELIGLLWAILAPPTLPANRPGRSRADTDQRHNRCVAATCALLNERFREPLSLDTIARSVYSSPAHLTRVFRLSTGMPVHRYRTRLRLLAAMEEICAGADDLTRLALDLGFSSHSHFTSMFRREFGGPPTTLRQELRASRLAA